MVAAAEGPEGTDEVSRIAAGVQALDIGSSGAQHGRIGEHADADAEAGHRDAAGLTGPQQPEPERHQQHAQERQRRVHRIDEGPAVEDDSGSEWTDDDGYDEEEEEADEWQVAGKSQNSVRRQRRKVRRTGCHRSTDTAPSVTCHTV